MKNLYPIFLLIAFCFFSNPIKAQFTFHNPDPSTNGNFISQLAERNGTLVGISRGEERLVEFDGNNWTTVSADAFEFAPISSNPSDLLIDENGDYWLVYFSTIDFFDGNEVINLTTSSYGLNNDIVMDVELDGNENMYFSFSNGYGVSIIKDGVWTHKGDHEGGLADLNNIFNASYMYYDEMSDAMWIYYAGDFYQVKDGNATLFPEGSDGIPVGLSVNNCRGAATTSDGKIWFALADGSGTEGGLLTFDGTAWNYLTTNDGLPGNTVRSVAAYQNLVIISDPDTDKISLLDDGVWTTFDASNSNWPESFFGSFYEMITIGDQVYIASSDGIIQLDLDVVSSEEINLSTEDLLYPNPTSGLVTFINSERFEYFELFNAQGQKIDGGKMKHQIDLSLNPAGYYYVILSSFTGELVQSKIMVE